MNIQRVWSGKEDCVLRKVYPANGVEGVLLLLPYRTKTAILLRARRLKVQYVAHIWTEKEISAVKKYYPLGGYLEVQKYLEKHRSRRSISYKARQLGVNRLWEDLSGKYIGKLFVLWKTHEAYPWRVSEEVPLHRSIAAWICWCENCGFLTRVFTSSALLYGRSVTCGQCDYSQATERARKSYVHEYERGLHRLIRNYKNSAKKREYEWLLTDDQALKLFLGSCAYCGAPPQRNSGKGMGLRDWGEFMYNGIDRVNNEPYYRLDNTVSCCADCNVAKRMMTKDAFLALVSKIYNHSIASKVLLQAASAGVIDPSVMHASCDSAPPLIQAPEPSPEVSVS